MKRFAAITLMLTGLIGLTLGAGADPQPAPHAALITIEGGIGPATSQYFERARADALEAGAELIILRIDTPGGLDGAMRDMIKRILDTDIPVVGWVGPSGARAASAGTYLMYATHVATMAPGTNLGSATPVPVGGSMPTPRTPAGEAKERLEEATEAGDTNEVEGSTEPADDDASVGEDTNSGDAMTNKVINDAVAYLRELAELRGRNADWAEQAVRVGANAGATEALERGVIDLIAGSLPELLEALDGREVAVGDTTVTLQTADLELRTLEPDWRERLLSTLTNPTVAYLLLMAGIYGLLLEGYSPGAILPGTVGAICLLLALFAFQMLPINYAGLGLLLLGLGLMVAEVFAPSFGVLGLGGMVAFVLGSVFLMDPGVPGFGLNLWWVAGVALASATLLAMTLYLFWRSRRAQVSAGLAVDGGRIVEVDSVIEGVIWGTIDGERWKLRADQPLTPGSRAKVVRVEGLTLIVEPLPNAERTP